MALGKVITISGVPGVGKSYIKDYLLENIENAEPAINVTTRLKDSDKETASDVEYVSNEEFQRRCMAGEVCGIRVSNGEWYGFKTEQIEKLDDGVNLIADVSYEGLEEVKDDLGNVISIYVLPKNVDREKKELQERYPDPEDLRKKLKEIEVEKKFFDEYGKKVFNIVVRNDYTRQTCEELKEKLEENMHDRIKYYVDREDQ